jgi:hypothetical protein
MLAEQGARSACATRNFWVDKAQGALLLPSLPQILEAQGLRG